jgi:hypothetical protein
MSAYISLVLGDLAIKIERRFISDDIPRMAIEGPKPERSADGTDIDFGSAYEDPFLLVFTALLDSPDDELINALYQEQQRRRRENLDYSILVIDTTSRHQERIPRTRAIAPATSILTLSPTYISYYPQLYCKFTTPPKLRSGGLNERSRCRWKSAITRWLHER